MARDGAAEGLWLRAERQTGGRGRQGREWRSPAGNLYASTLVRLRTDDPPAPSLALVAAVAVQEVASACIENSPSCTQGKVEIKWPNDLLVDGAKLCGILLERIGDAVVIGFGLNLAATPEGLDRPATSLAALTGAAPDAGVVLEMLVESFARWLERWRLEGISPVRARWLAVAHPVGTALSATIAGAPVQGLFDGLDDRGALRLRLADGTVHVIHAGDVFLI